MRDYLKEFSGDVIGDFLVENDIKDILNEASPGKNSPTDDGPPTFYSSLDQYKQETEDWIEQLQNDLGWKVINYILSDGAMDPEEDFTMSHRAINPISHGKVSKYKKTLRNVMDNLGWKVIDWMGVDKEDVLIAGPPVASGVDAQGRQEDNEMRTNQAAKRSGKKFKGGRPRLHVEKYSPLSKDWWNDELRELITEGGAYGHMAHPFDDKDLTFKDLRNIIERGLGGQLDREDNVTEKLDGQNLMISWREK